MTNDVSKLAHTLDWLVQQGLIPGLLPAEVTEAAALLRSQADELITLRAALNAKHHLVNVAVARTNPIRTTIRADFTIIDPVIYYGEMTADARMLRDERYRDHVAGTLTHSATRKWIADLQRQARIGVERALNGSA